MLEGFSGRSPGRSMTSRAIGQRPPARLTRLLTLRIESGEAVQMDRVLLPELIDEVRPLLACDPGTPGVTASSRRAPISHRLPEVADRAHLLSNA